MYLTVVLMNSKQLIKNQYRDQNQAASKHNILDKKSLIVVTNSQYNLHVHIMVLLYLRLTFVEYKKS